MGCVVVHHRRADLLAATLDGIARQSVCPERVVVVDNGGGASGLDDVLAAHPDVVLLRQPANGGYAAAVNAGAVALPAVPGALLAVLTHDCVLEPGAFEALAAELDRRPRTAAVGPLVALAADPSRVFSAGGGFEPDWRTRHVGAGDPVTAWRGTASASRAWLDGCCLMLRRDAFDACGGMPPEYFLYWEDVALLAELRRRGWDVRVVPAAVARQQPGTFPQFLKIRNGLHYLLRYAGVRAALRWLTVEARSVWWHVRRGYAPPRELLDTGRGVRRPSPVGWDRRGAGKAGVRRQLDEASEVDDCELGSCWSPLLTSITWCC